MLEHAFMPFYMFKNDGLGMKKARERTQISSC